MNKISVSVVARNEPINEIGGELHFMEKITTERRTLKYF